MSQYCMSYTYTKKVFVIYLKFKCNQMSCFTGNSSCRI